jgi:hypothetical protein
MQGYAHESRRRIAKQLAIALALLAVVFLLQVIPHEHTNGQNEAACLLCQAAHLRATPAVSGTVLSTPLVQLGDVTASNASATTECFFSHSDPRAPPAEVIL